MVANLLIVIFLVAMMYWWALQGFFSALMHLLITIIAGTIALALWEPIATNFLAARMPHFAFSVGLIGPFVLILLVLRVAADKIVPMGLDFDNATNRAGGAICGLLAGVIASGLTLIGLGFLPLWPSLAGYQPYSFDGAGNVQLNPDSSLWVDVDGRAARFYEDLSTGAFSPSFAASKSLALFRPQIDRMSALYRMTIDRNSSPGAVPGSIAVNEIYSHLTPVPAMRENLVSVVGKPITTGGNKMVVIDTQWQMTNGTYDPDSTLRISPTQVRLVAWEGRSRKEAKLFSPVGYSWKDPRATTRYFVPFDDGSTQAVGTSQQEQLAWAFVLPEDIQPRFLLVRNLRLDLASFQPKADPAQLRTAVGNLAPRVALELADAQDQADKEDEVGGREGTRTGLAATGVSLTNQLPLAISRVQTTNFRWQGDAILEGNEVVERASNYLSDNVTIREIYVPGHQAMVRVEIDRDDAQTMFGKAMAAAAQLQSVYIEDDLDQKWTPTAYVWLRTNQAQQITIDRSGGIRSAAQLPVSQMRPGEKLYLYFAVERGIELEAFHVGQTKQNLDLEVPPR